MCWGAVSTYLCINSPRREYLRYDVRVVCSIHDAPDPIVRPVNDAPDSPFRLFEQNVYIYNNVTSIRMMGYYHTESR